MSMAFFTEVEIQLKFSWNHRRSKQLKKFEQNVQGRGYYTTWINITKLYLLKQHRISIKNRYTDQKNTIETPEINPSIYSQGWLILFSVAPASLMGTRWCPGSLQFFLCTLGKPQRMDQILGTLHPHEDQETAPGFASAQL